MIDVNNPKVKNKIVDMFQEESVEEVSTSYEYFYVVKATLHKPIIKSWEDAENSNILDDLSSRINKATSWFNDGKKAKERKLELVTLDKNSKSLIVLISCTKEQKSLKITNKFGAFAKYLYNDMEFSKLVHTGTKQNRLFTTDIKQVNKDLDIISPDQK